MDWRSLAADICNTHQTCLEINGTDCAQRCGGMAVLNWFDEYQQTSVDVCALVSDVSDWSHQQYVMHVEKSRQASLDTARYVWSRMPVGAVLLLSGSNALGIKSTVKQFAKLVGVEPELKINKQRARVVSFVKHSDVEPYDLLQLQVPADEDESRQLWTVPGVFSANELDKGTALMQDCLVDVAERVDIVDMACGVGHLGLFLLERWPQCSCLFLDADSRALSCLNRNIQDFNYQERARSQWWAAGTQLGEASCDLVVMNPPAHSGKQVDYHAAFTMFRQAHACLRPGGEMYIIANIQLPYEKELKTLLGTFSLVREEDGFKVMCVRKDA